MEHLRQLRLERGLSQQNLGDMFSLTQQSIHKYETGLAEPDIDTLKKFAAFFHTTIDYLVDYNSKDVLVEEMSLPQNELHHLDLYRKMSVAIQKHLDGFLDEVKL